MSLPDGFVAGMTWGYPGRRGEWGTPTAAESMRLMRDRLGITWTTLAFAAYQDTPFSTEIRFRDAPTVTDDEVVWAIREAKDLGLRVCLKPMVNCADGTWRAHINFLDIDVPGEPTWTEWWAAYREYMVHFAGVAEAEGANLLCVGCEQVQSDRRADDWRALIAAVREAYSGPLTYDCNKYQEDRLTWWDAVDVISCSGYYPQGDWGQALDRIAPVVARHGKPFIFMEGGCPSRVGAPADPGNWRLQAPPSEEAQDGWYRDLFAATASRPWVRGFMFWDWRAVLHAAEDAATNDDYGVYAKAAEATIRETYRERLG
jgi:hypothetical protein